MALVTGQSAGANTGELPKNFLEELAIFTSVMNADLRRHSVAPFNWGNSWRKANPVDLIDKLILNLNEAQSTGTTVAWAKVANYCMMLASIEPEQKARLTAAAKSIVVQVTPAEVEAAGPLLLGLSQQWEKTDEPDKGAARNILKRLYAAVRPLFVARTDPKGPGGESRA